jgi:hypothetical protein
MNNKTIRDFELVDSNLSHALDSDCFYTSTQTDIFILTRDDWKILFSDTDYLIYTSKHSVIRVDATDPLADRHVYWIILSMEYDACTLINTSSILKTLNARKFISEAQAYLVDIITALKAPYILIESKKGEFIFDFMLKQIVVSHNRLTLIDKEHKQGWDFYFPLKDNYLEDNFFKDLTSEPKPKQKPVVETSCFTKSKPKQTYNFDFTIKANIPISVSADDYESAVQEALKRIAQASLAGVDYEIINSKFKGQQNEK